MARVAGQSRAGPRHGPLYMAAARRRDPGADQFGRGEREVIRHAVASCFAASVPVVVFGVVFAVTCMVGALLLLSGQPSFVAGFEYFSGTKPPLLTPEQAQTALVLLVLPPLFLCAGYVVAFRGTPTRWVSWGTAGPVVFGGRLPLGC